jgi:hypothetical protein
MQISGPKNRYLDPFRRRAALLERNKDKRERQQCEAGRKKDSSGFHQVKISGKRTCQPNQEVTNGPQECYPPKLIYADCFAQALKQLLFLENLSCSCTIDLDFVDLVEVSAHVNIPRPGQPAPLCP